MCTVDWNLLANVVTAIASLATVVLALIALRSWRIQLHGSSKHAAAQQIAVAARMLSYAFYDARSPMIWAGEFPPEYYETGHQDRTNALVSRAYQHVYGARWKELWPYVSALAKLRPLAGAVFDDSVAKAVEDLARKARELQFLQEQDIQHKRDGDELVGQYGDQNFVRRVRDSVQATKDSDDPLTMEFEAEMKKLLDLLSKY